MEVGETKTSPMLASDIRTGNAPGSTGSTAEDKRISYYYHYLYRYYNYLYHHHLHHKYYYYNHYHHQ
jgi:hypothetical protein